MKIFYNVRLADSPTASPTTPPTSPPTSPPIGPVDCDFEQEDLCGWSVDFELNGTEYFQFRRSTGEIDEGINAGPTEDREGSKAT